MGTVLIVDDNLDTCLFMSAVLAKAGHRGNFPLCGAAKLPADKRAEQWQQYEALTPEQKKVLRSAGSTSNTAARHAGANTALAKEAAKPIAPVP